MSQGIQRRTKAEIHKLASEFLAKHNPERTIPVPIDLMVERGLGIGIVPIPNLAKGPRGINAYLTDDKEEIYIDDYIMENQETRYRFTIAHEVGHLILHGHFYGTLSSDADWINLRNNLTNHSVTDAETQADMFANAVLIPTASLIEFTNKVFVELADQVIEQIPDFDLKIDEFWGRVSNRVRIHFLVSAPAAEIGLRRTELWGTDRRFQK